MKRSSWLLSAVCSIACGCAVGPDYERPAVPVPPAFRAAEPGAGHDAASLADQPWQRAFTEPALLALIEAALRDGYDARIAALRVLQAEAQAGVVRSAALPTVGVEASAAAQRLRFAGRGEPITGGLFELGASLSWEVDFWGRFSRAGEAARAQIVASEWGRRAVATTLVSQVSSAYFRLRALDRQLDIAERTLASRRESLRLTEVRERGGAGSLVDVKQAEQLVFGASGQIVDLKRSIEQRENLIRLLVGQTPGPVARGEAEPLRLPVAEVPSGLPSALLERRPDIHAAEQRLIAANAEIGVAEADYFPRFTLTAAGGFASAALVGLLEAPALVWSAAASLAQPIFDGGRRSAQVSLAVLERDAAAAEYRQTVLRALREVSDALVEHAGAREFRAIQEELVRSAREARRLVELRYQGGSSSYLEVLDSDTRSFGAELSLVQAELEELLAYVEIYRALGGGWKG